MCPPIDSAKPIGRVGARGAAIEQAAPRAFNHRAVFLTSVAGRVSVLAVALSSIIALVALCCHESPGQRLKRALHAMDVADWERLQYQHAALKNVRGYESQAGLLAGALRLQAGELDSALDELEFAAVHPDTSVRALVLAGEALYAKDNFHLAERTLRAAVTIDPDCIEAHRWLATAYYDIGLMNEALAHFQRVADLDPSDPRPHRIMGVLRMDHGNPATAADDFEESLRRDPNQVDADQIRLELAQCQERLHRFADAQHTLANCSESAGKLALLASMQHAEGRAEKARRLAEAALELAPEQRLALLVLGKLAFDDLRFGQAVELLSQAAEAAPKDHDIRYTLAIALRAAGRAGDAKRELEAAEDLRRLRERSEDVFRDALANRYNADLRYELGLLAEEVDMFALAESWFHAAVMLAQDHPEARAKLEEYKVRKRRGEREPTILSHNRDRAIELIAPAH